MIPRKRLRQEHPDDLVRGFTKLELELQELESLEPKLTEDPFFELTKAPRLSPMNTPELPDEVLSFRLGGYPCGSSIIRSLTLGRSIYSQHVQDQEFEDSEPLSGESRDLE